MVVLHDKRIASPCTTLREPGEVNCVHHGGETEVHEIEGTCQVLGKPDQVRIPANVLIPSPASSWSWEQPGCC